MIFRSRKGGADHLRGRDWLFVWIGTLIGPPLLLGVPGLLLAQARFGASGGIDQLAIGLMLMQLYAPVVTFFAIPFGLLIGRRLVRAGLAGWAVAVSLPALAVALVMAGYVSAGTGYPASSYIWTTCIFMFSASIHGLTAWMILRLVRPQALLPA